MAYVHNTDRHIGGNIYLSLGALYQHRENTLMVAQVVNRSIDQFRKYLSLPDKIVVRIAPIKGNTNGRYNSSGQLVELDCRLPWDKALEVFAHELVHAEQYHEGRLVKSYESHRGWVHWWNGELGNRGSTYRAYRNQPWEMEAWGRQAELAEKVCQDLEKIYA